MVDAAMEQALRAGEIIRRLREFVAKRETERRRESIEPAVREAAELVLVGHQQSDLRILYDFDHQVTFMLADRVEVQQVLVNLLRNSIEAMKLFPKENKEIHLQTRALETQMVEFTVRDNGPGIPETVLSRMYQPFTSTKGGSGMGIGLSICRRIVQAHGGTLEAGNDPNGGACFRFTLPSIGDEELQA
jgi:two-component system sensor kinase FixL